jgi:hypothetical protein
LQTEGGKMIRRSVVLTYTGTKMPPERAGALETRIYSALLALARSSAIWVFELP